MNKALPLWLTLALVGSMSAVHAQEVKGDAARGAKMTQMCVGCHGIPGYKASFPEVYKVPAIYGQNDKYIVAALTAYRKGDRKQPSMDAIAASLTDQDIADLAAYFSQSGHSTPAPEALAVQPSPQVSELLTKGACTSCHGANFSKPIDAAYPKIAGQYPSYIDAALKAYKHGNRLVSRDNPIMGAQAKQFSDKELAALADYIGSLPSEISTVADPKFR